MAKGLLDQPDIAGVGQQSIGQCVAKSMRSNPGGNASFMRPMFQPSAELASADPPARGGHEQGLRDRGQFQPPPEVAAQ